MEVRKRLYSGITLGSILVMALVLVQPTIEQASAVGVEGLPAYDNCPIIDATTFSDRQSEDPISMNTVRSGNIVKTMHAEKEIFFCFLEQGNLRVIVDVTTYVEIYENIVDRQVIETNAVATTCLKDELTAIVIDCQSYEIPTTPVFAGSNCTELEYITHPQEMNTVTKGKIAKTIEAQKEVFFCALDLGVKKVDVILFTDIYEDLATQTVTEMQFHSMRCVTLLGDFGDLIDSTVETCQFSTIEN